MNFPSVFSRVERHMPRVLAKKLPREVVARAVSSRQSRTVNSRYRGKRVPANVLSFRYDNDYGEILVCPAAIRREAKKQGNSYCHQMTWMVLHGMLHLAGMHHEKSKLNARRFEGLEKTLLKKLSPMP